MRRIRAALSGSGDLIPEKAMMKNGKKRICTVLLALLCALLSACSGGAKVTGAEAATFSELNADGETVTIPTDGIAQTARFFNYDADGVTVQLVALRDGGGKVHAAFNTCQSCSPSPKAYYRQTGDVLECANCGFTFAPEEVGITHGVCNPWPVAGIVIGDDEITVPTASLDEMRPAFLSWAGPTGRSAGQGE